jgi:hypothetical protein
VSCRTSSFVGTVVECTTRFQTTAQTAIVVDPIMANWVVIVDVEQADAGAPRPAGERVAFVIHSPTHTFFERAEDVIGGRFRFTITAEGERWRSLQASRV